MTASYAILTAALLALAVAKQILNRRTRYRAAACCAFGEAAIALAFACNFALPLVVQVAAVLLVAIELASGATYMDKAKPRA